MTGVAVTSSVAAQEDVAAEVDVATSSSLLSLFSQEMMFVGVIRSYGRTAWQWHPLRWDSGPETHESGSLPISQTWTGQWHCLSLVRLLPMKVVVCSL